MRKALVVGIDYYENIGSLDGCVADATGVAEVLARHEDGSVNFPQPKVLTAPNKRTAIGRAPLRDAIQELFRDDSEVALLYFAGHGHLDTAGGYICASDCQTGDDGVSLFDVTTWANQSRARNKVILLDSCYSGALARNPMHGLAEISEGMTILTASTDSQLAAEENDAGVFTTLLLDALHGAAANLLGDITPASVYAHIDQSLGTWSQRPVFKTNIKRFISLRKVTAPVRVEDLRRIAEFFPTPDYQFPLDPSFEPESISPDPSKNAVFAILQKYNRVNLLVPVDAPHMWHAAMENKAVRLTPLGKHYHRLVRGALI